jgi:DNA mismatch repair protein MutH
MSYLNVETLLEKAESLKGVTISNLLKEKDFDKGKGAIGNIIEREGFGIANNNDARPDFEELGIELKVLPLKKNAKGDYSVKERTKVCSINYKELINENWEKSHARYKLDKILFIFYHYDKEDNYNSEILDYLLFHLESSDEPLIKSDWERTKGLVEEGKAHLLSESQNLVLAASRSGAGKLEEKYWPDQPNQIFSKKARQRAFSLKPSFTKVLWSELNNKDTYDKISKKTSYTNYQELEYIILNKLNIWEGKSLKEFAVYYDLQMNSSKNAAATIVRTALGFEGKNKPVKEIEQLGLLVKMSPCRKKDNYPYESMSFPFQPLREIQEETRFDESEFYTYLQGFLIIPIYRESRKEKDLEKMFFGKSKIWRPTKDDLLGIQKEWELVNKTINEGIQIKTKAFNNRKGFIQENNLPKESETDFIHMRPHGRDSDDVDKSITEISITKQCFWFNKKLIQRIIS